MLETDSSRARVRRARRRARSSASTIERVVLERPPEARARRPRLPRRLRPRQGPAQGAPRDRRGARRGRGAARPACARRGSRGAATSTSSSTAAPVVRALLAGPDAAPAARRARSSSSTRTSTRTRPRTSATCATPSSATSSCACCATSATRSRSRTTSTTPASRSPTSWSASLHLAGRRRPSRPRGRSSASAASPAGRSSPKGFAYLCWDLYAEVGRTYAARPETKAWRAEVLHAIEAGGQRDRRGSRRPSSEAVSAAHLATMGRLGIAYDLLPARERHPAPALLGAGLRAAEGGGRHPPRDRGQERRLLGAAPRRSPRSSPGWTSRTRSSSARTAPSPTPARTSPTSSGSSASSAIDFDYERLAARLELRRGRASRRSRTAVRAHPVWRTAHAGGAPGAPAFGRADARLQRHRRAPVLPAEGGAGGAARPRLTDARPTRSIHFAYEMVALSPTAARELAERFGEEYRLSRRGREEALRRDVGPQGARREGRRPRRAPPRALAGRGRDRGAARRAAPPRPSADAARSRSARCATSC